ncbi:MAG: molecular chaperone DjiA [Proteobacteria bacterium]|jgi:DnaJ like chaperone protein|nr:TerB family tellurite resistance protein [Alphaproteobacteria bacterium]NCC03273.1 molecular chaperone DjiA [Pseudomonadota bacterium]
MDRIIGKLTGFALGLVMGGLKGGLFGLALGHIHDRTLFKKTEKPHQQSYNFFPDFQIDEQYRAVFSIGVIVLGAKLAKIDGTISRQEVMAFRYAFRTDPPLLRRVGQLFDEARKSSDGYEPYAARLAQTFINKKNVLEDILSGLFFIAKADNPHLTREEMLFLRRVAVIFGFAEDTFIQVAARVGVYLTSIPPEPRKDTAYDVLGLPTTASDDVIKRTYRALIRKYHPDKLLAAGLPASSVNEATERVKSINAAYAEICKKRDIK